MNKELLEHPVFTEDHSRALMINGLVEFNLIPSYPADEDIPILVDIMASVLLPSNCRFRADNHRNLLLKMSEWSSKKSAIEQQQFYQELAQLSSLDPNLLTPSYLKQREEQKRTLESRAALTFFNDLVQLDPQQIDIESEKLSYERQVFVAKQSRLFLRGKDNYERCIASDNFNTDTEAVALLVSYISGYSDEKDVYLPLNLILAMVVGREDFVELLVKMGHTLDTIPIELLQHFAKALHIKLEALPTLEHYDTQAFDDSIVEDDHTSDYVAHF